jgi:RimJ/RimL family protein N-acetyltransferase
MKQTPIPVEINFVDSKCPYCGNTVSFRDQWIGQAHRCPNCWQILIVPKPGVEVGAKLPIPLQTSRLLLRRLVPMDLSDVLEIVGDEDMVRYFDWYPMGEKEVVDWLADEQKKPSFRDRRLYLALELLEQPKVIGLVAVGFLKDANPETASSEMYLEVFVNRNYQRRGFATGGISSDRSILVAGRWRAYT